MKNIIRLEDLNSKYLGYIERAALLDDKKIKENQKLINDIINEIKLSSEKGTILSLTKIKKEYSISMADCRMLMSHVKGISNVLTEKCSEIDGKIIPVNSRPEIYKWINNIDIIQFRDRLINYVDDFASNDVEYLKQYSEHKDVNTILSVYNYLLTHDFKDQWIKMSITELSRKIPTPINTLFEVLKILNKDNKVLFSVEHRNMYMYLNISSNNTVKQSTDDKYIEQKVIEQSSKIQDFVQNNDKLEEDDNEKCTKQRVPEESSKIQDFTQNNNDKLEKDINYLKNGIINFFENQKQLINESIANQQYKFNKTGEVIDKLVKSNNELNDKLKQQNDLIIELKKERDDQDKNLIALRSYSDKLFKHTIDVLEMLMGELSNMTDEFVKIPRHQLHQNNEATRYKGKFCSAIGKRVNEIVEYTPDSNMPEKELK